MDTPTKLQRWLDLIAYLVGRRYPVAGDELLSNIPAYSARWKSHQVKQQQSARRMFERDKDELRGAGIPIQTVRYSVAGVDDVTEGYRIDRRDFYLPYLKIVEQYSGVAGYSEASRPASVEVSRTDAPLALEALRRVSEVPAFPFVHEARTAFRKLAFDLEPQAFTASRAVLYAERPGTAELLGDLRLLSDALLARKRVTFRYHGIYRGEETKREVAPYGLLFQGGHWYLVGHDRLREDIRVFRVERMEDVVANTQSPKQRDYEIPAGFSLRTYADRRAWELGDPAERGLAARVRFHFPLSLWAERNRHGEAETNGTDGAVIRRFDVQQTQPFLRWLLGLEGQVELLEPPELREELAAMRRRIAEAHADA